MFAQLCSVQVSGVALNMFLIFVLHVKQRLTGDNSVVYSVTFKNQKTKNLLC